ATRRDQRALITSLAAMPGDISKFRIGSPAIMVIGETVRYACDVALHETIVKKVAGQPR
ncbi:MAG: hypothetical protein HY255_03560, partial [Betaproteobacteria bacterium]|nr:hypothetical protein [Betaproteobacteria bacterium]